jgi:hypothetical protein
MSEEHPVCALTDLLKGGSVKEPLTTLLNDAIDAIKALPFDAAEEISPQIAVLACSFEQAASHFERASQPVASLEEEVERLQKQITLLKGELQANQKKEVRIAAELVLVKKELRDMRASNTADKKSSAANTAKLTLRDIISDAETALLLRYGRPFITAKWLARKQIFGIHDAVGFLEEKGFRGSSTAIGGAAALPSHPTDSTLLALETAIARAREEADMILSEDQRVALRGKGRSIAHPFDGDIDKAEADILAVPSSILGFSKEQISKAVLLYKHAAACLLTINQC